MNDTEPQTAAGKVLWHVTMSLDGFVAGPNPEMDWMSGTSSRPGLEDEYVATTGAVRLRETADKDPSDIAREFALIWQAAAEGGVLADAGLARGSERDAHAR